MRKQKQERISNARSPTKPLFASRARFVSLEVKVKIDWFSVISDLERTGMTQREIADYIGVSKSTVNSWKQYNEPRYGSGAALLDLWKSKTKGQEIER
ncbi:XRE family transcriptional regulator [Salmonella enterica subsp. enterica serovar Hvittingfoss]|nr:XRE family transcriptional regulator [Salmonella enterica subsp. enterica serovar Hvittingfoss]